MEKKIRQGYPWVFYYQVQNEKIEGKIMEYMWDLQRKQRKEFPEMYPEEKL